MEDFPVAMRLKSIIEALGLTDSQFADKCSISRPTLSLILAGKNKKISDVMLSQIHDAFPDVSILWLLFGEGERFKKENPDSPEGKNDDENLKINTPIHNETEYSNLIDLKQLENSIQQIINQSIESSIQQLKDIVIKIKEPVSNRKVAGITVYYDDSTFETFLPEQ